jgi:ribonuclease HIII
MTHPLLQTPEFRRWEALCRAAGAQWRLVREIQSGVQVAVRRGSEEVLANVYGGRKGVKVWVQGSGPLREALAPTPDPSDPPYRAWIGSDESGKGDYFGPLVVAAVRVDARSAGELSRKGVRDSKELGDARIQILDRAIRAAAAVAVVRIDPPEYNRRHADTRNVNAILGGAHAEAIEEALRIEPDAEAAIVDQFGNERYLLRRLGERGKKILLIQRPKAESDAAVAAASIVARAEFVRALDELSREFDMDLPKGAGAPVLAAAREFVARHGREALIRAAKVHFRTTGQVLPPSGRGAGAGL